MNEFYRALMEGVLEIVGTDEARDLFQQAQPTGKALPGMRQLEQVFEARYGQRSGQGVAQRAGRASFKYGLRRWGEKIGMTDASFALLPPMRKIRSGLDKISKLLSEQLNVPVAVSEDASAWYWQIGCCELSTPVGGTSATCHLLIGLLQEYVSWAGGNRFYRVAETQCMASGAKVCLFQIEKKPIE